MPSILKADREKELIWDNFNEKYNPTLYNRR
jgi:hypothetical protein